MPKTLVPPLFREGGHEERRKAKSNRRKPKAHERGVAAALGGRVQPGSGAFEGAKGDVRKDTGEFQFLVECKRTEGKGLRLEAEWLDKITREATGTNKYPALSVQFDQEVAATAEQTWMAVPMTVFRALLEAAEGHRKRGTR